LEKKKAHDEKIARGEKVEPLKRDPTAEEEVGLLGLLKFIVVVLVCVTLAGKFFTGSYTWEYRSKWLQMKTYWPVSYGLILIPMVSTLGNDVNPITIPLFFSPCVHSAKSAFVF